jgi:hypothetical protein
MTIVMVNDHGTNFGGSMRCAPCAKALR